MESTNPTSAGQSNSMTQRKPSIDTTQSQCRRQSIHDPMPVDPATSRTGTNIILSPRDGTTPAAFPAYAPGITAMPIPDAQRTLSQFSKHSSTRASRTSISSLASPVKAPGKLTDMDVTHRLYQLLEQVEGAGDVDLVDVYQNASLLPPVTHDSLCELDIIRIINNPKLRHDVNFDKELHFRPNLDGSRGRHKLKAAEDYWKALIAELELYRAVGAQLLSCTSRADAEYWERTMTSSQKRIPGMFETIRKVIETLVPDRDQIAVQERLDIAMIMQQISKGCFDLMSLAQWLAKLLKAHCAPMRDDWIDQMVAQTQVGVDESSQERVVYGLRQLLSILEAMKLDVANHQIRHLRALLIEDTINFQQRYFEQRMMLGRIDVPRAQRWLESGQENMLYLSGMSAPAPDKLQGFTFAILKAVLSQESMSGLPETFQLDVDRLRSIRHDLHHLITLDMCCDLYQEILKGKLSGDALTNGRTNLRAALRDILGDRRRPNDQAGNLAVEIVRLASQGNPDITVMGTTYVSDLVEAKLKTMLSFGSSTARMRANVILQEQFLKLHMSIKAGLKLTTPSLHEAMIPQSTSITAPFKVPTTKSTKPESKRNTVDDVLRRLTHIAVLHWQIWSALIYAVEEEGTAQQASDSGLQQLESRPTSHRASTTGTPQPSMSIEVEMTTSHHRERRDSVAETTQSPVLTEPKA